VLANVLHVIALIWITLAEVVILVGYVSILVFQGLDRLQETVSPFNVWNVVAVVVTLSPGLGVEWLSRRFRRRSGAAN
jgi:hypothetical protein